MGVLCPVRAIKKNAPAGSPPGGRGAGPGAGSSFPISSVHGADRVDGKAVDVDLVVKVGAGRPPGVPDFPDDVPLLHHRRVADRPFGHVAVDRAVPRTIRGIATFSAAVNSGSK